MKRLILYLMYGLSVLMIGVIVGYLMATSIDNISFQIKNLIGPMPIYEPFIFRITV